MSEFESLPTQVELKSLPTHAEFESLPTHVELKSLPTPADLLYTPEEKEADIAAGFIDLGKHKYSYENTPTGKYIRE
jgi:hypothetical protein